VAKDVDLELLLAWRGGDEDAGKQLFERWFERLYRFFCNKVGQDVDDLVQETLFQCVRSRDTFRAESSFRTYVFAVARHCLLRYRDKFARAGDAAEFDQSRVRALDASPATLACERQEQRALLRALRRLPLELQVLLELYYWDDLTSAELAEILQIPHGTVRSRLRRGKELVRETLATLAESGELLHTTTDDFDRWLRSIRAARPAGT